MESSSADRKTGTSVNIAASIFRDLRRQILRGELPSGERLPGERELAQRYSTNRNTLREAVRMLEQARLVTVRHGQGVTISDFRRTGTMDLLPPFIEQAVDLSEVTHLLEDILPARLLVLEFSARLAVRRASPEDVARIKEASEQMIAAFERTDAVAIAVGFQRWLEAMIDAGHSVAVRWIGNPFLDAYRELLDRFPALWVLEPTFPQHLRDLLESIENKDEERALHVMRDYYERVDRNLMQALFGLLEKR
ncbi:MAG TPA: GntR family transcriptional regulator [Polyangiaceae bacterium]|nr:GntR family transcriptional regulator [Polyangiaceae bacterium]